MLNRIWLSPEWMPYWNDLGIKVETFDSLGLDKRTSDVVLWQLCQREEYILVTVNRNNDDADSLNIAIASLSSESSLPVITVSDVRRFERDRDDVEAVAGMILDRLQVIDRYRGTGRLDVP